MIKNDLVSLLARNNRPTSVAEILSEITANKTTIYRELDNLVDERKVFEVEFGDGKKRYELSNKKHHHHLVCRNCGKIQDVHIDENELLKCINKRKFIIENHSIEFFGKCGNCAKL